MSFLWKPIAGGGIAGTAVDPLGPGGVLIEVPTEILQVPGPPLPAGHVIQADGLGGFVMGPQSGGGSGQTFAIQYSHDGGVPAFGTRYLRFGQGVISSVAGFRMSAAGQLRAITVQVNTTSPSTYDVEVLRDPAGRLGAPAVLATLTLSPGTLFTVSGALAVAVAAADELGVRMVRTAGALSSSFSYIVVKTEWSIP